MTLRVAVVGSGPAGSSAAETLVKAGIETYLFERKLDYAKPCGGAIPLCMVQEFDLPQSIIDRQVRKMKMISPSNVEVDINIENAHEYIGMCRREVLDGFLRDRAALGAKLINGTVHTLELPANNTDPYTLHYADHSNGAAMGIQKTLKVDLVIGADGANSRVAKAIDAGDYNYAIAFQERIRLPEDKMAYYHDLAEMYVGDDVSTDFYAWVFPKYDHVAVGTGTMKVNQASIKKLQAGVRARAAKRLMGGEIIKVEAHPIPEHPRPRRVVADCSRRRCRRLCYQVFGRRYLFCCEVWRMCAETIVEISNKGARIPTEEEIKIYLKRWDKAYGITYKVLDILQRVFYRSDATREAFVEMCADRDVQKLTFDSYLYKTVVPANPFVQMKITAKTIGSLLRGSALAP